MSSTSSFARTERFRARTISELGSLLRSFRSILLTVIQHCWTSQQCHPTRSKSRNNAAGICAGKASAGASCGDTSRLRCLAKSAAHGTARLNSRSTRRADPLALAMANLGAHASLLASDFASPFARSLGAHTTLQKLDPTQKSSTRPGKPARAGRAARPLNIPHFAVSQQVPDLHGRTGAFGA